MIQYLLKLLITAALVVAIGEIAKRSTFLGGIIASLPLTSLLAIIWLYHDTGDIEKISKLSEDIYFMVIPSLTFFILLPRFLKTFSSFYVSLSASAIGCWGFYYLWMRILSWLKIS